MMTPGNLDATSVRLRILLPYLRELDPQQLKKTAKRFYQKCVDKNRDDFWTWRNKILDLKEQGLLDVNFGYYYPFLISRCVFLYDELTYETNKNLESFQKMQALCTKVLINKFTYSLGCYSREPKLDT